VFIITNLFCLGAFAQTATVTTDKDDYAPSSIITGTGWQAGETVSFHFAKPKPATHLLSHDITNTVADAET
jgi:hypothetical protein